MLVFLLLSYAQPNHRVKHSEAVLYDRWPDLQIFRMAVQKAKEKGVWKWSTECAAALRPAPPRGQQQ